MKYKLYKNGSNDISNIVKEVLRNRGIYDYRKYLNLTSDVELSYNRLCNIADAVETFANSYENNNKIGILVDEDVDGFTSASIMYSYIKKMNDKYPVEYILHTKTKSHGLGNDVIIPDDIKLLIIPDAGTNDVDRCRELSEKNVRIIVLDHHEAEIKNEYAIIVNNQMSEDYTNKNLSGVGIVYKFLQALDDFYWCNYADSFIDLVALGLIGDVMDIRSFETKYLINKGLSQITNKCFLALIQAQDYSIQNKYTVHNIQWYIIPIINALIRVGTYEDKELLFKALIEQDEYFEYTKRAYKNNPKQTIQESIYDRVARLCKNLKSKQDKPKEKSVNKIKDIIAEKYMNDKVIILDCEDYVDSSLTGVVAMGIADAFHRPCILVHKGIKKDKREGRKILYGGSSRNCNHSPVINFKDLVNESGLFEFAMGHQSAFGVSIIENNLELARKFFNNALYDIDFDSYYFVDFIIDYEELNFTMINELSKIDTITGQGIDQPLIVLTGFHLHKNDFNIIGKKSNTITFSVNDIKYIMFNCKEGQPLFDWLNDAWNDDNFINFELVGRCGYNVYNGVKEPQIFIEDINVV